MSDFNDVYVAPEDYVKIGMKQMVAERMLGWLREYAEFSEVAGATQTAEDARAIANRIEHELDELKEDQE